MQEVFQPVGKIIKKTFGFNKARIACLLMLIETLIRIQTVNLSVLSNHFYGEAKRESHYRRIRRFVAEVVFDWRKLAPFLVSMSPLMQMDKWTLIFDRTNWKLGKEHRNILYLSVAYKGLSIPLFGHY